jgi:hypothetical protein
LIHAKVTSCVARDSQPCRFPTRKKRDRDRRFAVPLLLEHAVCCEPLSRHQKSLLNREITGNFADFSLHQPERVTKNTRFRLRFLRKFPTPRNREIFSANRDFFRRNSEFDLKSREAHGLVPQTAVRLTRRAALQPGLFRIGQAGRRTSCSRAAQMAARLGAIPVALPKSWAGRFLSV